MCVCAKRKESDGFIERARMVTNYWPFHRAHVGVGRGKTQETESQRLSEGLNTQREREGEGESNNDWRCLNKVRGERNSKQSNVRSPPLAQNFSVSCAMVFVFSLHLFVSLLSGSTRIAFSHSVFCVC